MARKVIEQLIDDLDGTEIADGEAESITLTIDSKTYKLDLRRANAEQLRALLRPYLAAATQVRSGKTKSGSAHSTQEVRNWAIVHGYQVSSRGRISREILAAYQAATS